MNERRFEPDVGVCPECASTDTDIVKTVSNRGLTALHYFCWSCGWSLDVEVE